MVNEMYRCICRLITFKIIFFYLLNRSVVSLGEKLRVVGAAAKTQMISNVKNTVWGFKTLIGKQFKDSSVQRDKAVFPYEIVEGPNGAPLIKVC